MNDPDQHAADPDEVTAGPTEPAEQPAVEPVVEPADAEALVRLVVPVRSVPRRVDPEDWSRSGGDDDERYQRERPPHWE
ncbi:hypothetical protein [Kineosporia sp. R_H_3]|uniref:hypothetical protein n=1 Tax=Kineosporia sp. R_H_3 TaxID=1961848 RepID=UPI000B4ACD42|nr:hypothetical protein [Kineosporia sp. R_H_3]